MTAGVGVLGWALSCAVSALVLRLWTVSRVRRRSTYLACHELRGPLTAARLGLELEARAGHVPAPRLRAIDLELRRAALALEDLQRFAGGRHRAAGVGECESVNVAELLADSVEAWRGVAERRGVELRMSWSGACAPISADRLRLAQATGNLIANAIEHGQGPIDVRGRFEGARVRIEVIDRGPGLGVPIAELIRLPRLMRRGPLRGPGRRRIDPLRGHGLAIAAAVAAAHGGRLAAAPSERGARLVLELPAPAEAVSRAAQ